MKPRAADRSHDAPFSGHPRFKAASRAPVQYSLVLAALVAALSVGSAWAEPKFPPSTAGEATSSQSDQPAPVPPAIAPVPPHETPLPPPVSMRWAGLRVAAAVLAVGLLLAGGVVGYRRLVDRAGRTRSARGRMRARHGWWQFFAPDTPSEADRIHLASRRYLGSRESLAVVHVGRERFLVGVTGASISLVSRLGDPDRPAEGGEPEAADFAVELAAATQPRRSGPEPRRSFLRPPTAQGELADPATTDPATTDPATVTPATTDPATTIRSRIARSRDRLERLGHLTAVAPGSHD